ncbi:MAG: asparagine synthase (glutamine-hydrolyzing) [Ferruginibacter sp.]
MCGIAGIISVNGLLVRKEALKIMADAIAHRGPDGENFWINEELSVGFAHRRLSIIDLSDQAMQPMHYANRYSIVYNGEIYNYIEVREKLFKKGYRFNTKSDIEVILAAYDCWQEECLQEFEGMFAFAIWDSKEQELFAARDRFGEKPFYYYEDDDQLIFASEMKALWAVGVNKKADQKMLLNYITIGHVQNAVDKEETFFKDIYSLPPSHYLQFSVKRKRLTIKRYWNINKERLIKISESDAIEQFTELLTLSVKRRLRSDVSVGASLSGGLDSSAITSIVNGFQKNHVSIGSSVGSLQTFSATFPGFNRDESPYIQSIKDKFKIDNFQTQPNADDLVRDFEKLCYHQEEPFSSSSIYAQYKVFELAKQHNVKVLLDGQGADETLAGYHKYLHWYIQQLISSGKYSLARSERNAFKKNKMPFTWDLKNYIATFFPPHTAVQLERKEYNTILRHPDISDKFILSIRGREWEGILKITINNLNDILYFNTMQSGLEELLRYADRNSMAHGREARFPFLNHDLVQFIFSLPASFKIQKGWTKWLLRKSMENKLPENITWRTDKVGYEPPQEQWMKNPSLQEYIHEAKRKLVDHGILKHEVLNKKIAEHPVHHADNFDWRYLCAAQTLL